MSRQAVIPESDFARVGKMLAIISIQWMVQERHHIKPNGFSICGKRCILRNRIEECTFISL